jgi:predicted DCC family thiol-disulfide oxidoreductase YuxK
MKILYDDVCGFCRRWVPLWGRILAAHGIAIEGAVGLEDLRAVDVRGHAHDGADAYRFVFRRLPWAAPFWILSTAPVLRRIFDAGYRLFARNRYRIWR